MTKILYIPNGEYISFSACVGIQNYTLKYTESEFGELPTSEACVFYICDPTNTSCFFKERNNLPDGVLLREEFEIIEDD